MHDLEIKEEQKYHGIKRKYQQDHGTDAKRIKSELLPHEVQVIQRRGALPSLARRTTDEVLRDVVTKVAQGDRQMAGRLLREFSNEHISTIEKHSENAAALLLEALFKAKHDQVANAVLNYLRFVLINAEREVIASTLVKLFRRGREILQKPALDIKILTLLTSTIELGVLRDVPLSWRVFQCVNRSLRNSNSIQARICAVQFHIARVFHAIPRQQQLFHELELTLAEMTADRDARVRLAAADGISQLSMANELTLSVYNIAKKLAADSDSQVRKLILRVLLNFALRNHASQIINHSGQYILLCDDAFSCVCNAINDMEVDVRAEAASLLGDFEYISEQFLDQTLDKKLMRTMKATGAVKYEKNSMFSITKQPWKTGGQRWKSWKDTKNSKDKNKSSEWASGKDLNAPCPNNPGTSNDDDEESIIPQGACGAFITALEDEFMSVRKGAVYSLGKLAAHRPYFASSALEHLTDMFNDEIADVRLDAIHALTPLVVHGQLVKEQLAVMLKCLDDAMYESRQALRDLLGKGEFADADCMKMTTKALINCLQRFPGDKDMIYRCFSQLGERHGLFVHSMVEGLLDLHPIFEPQEQLVDNVFYLGKLILILSAASLHEPIISMLPNYVLKHYRFMRASVPHLVPPIRTLDEKFELNSDFCHYSEIREVNAEILEQTYTKLCDSTQLPTVSERNKIREFITRDAEAILSFNTALAGAAQFLSILTELISASDSLEENVIRGGDLSRLEDIINEEIAIVLGALIMFTDVDGEIQTFLYALSFHLNLLKGMTKLSKSPESYANIIQEIRETISESKRVSEQFHSVMAGATRPLETHEQAMEEIMNVLEGTGEVDEKKFLSIGRLADIISKNSPQVPNNFQRIEKIRVKWAQITEPDRQTVIEKPTTFIAGYPTTMSFSISLHHFYPEDISDIRIQIDYPDQSKVFYKPRPGDFCRTGETSFNLETKVLIQSSVPWADSALVKFTIVQMAGPHKSIPVAVLESPTIRKPSSLVARIRPVYKIL